MPARSFEGCARTDSSAGLTPRPGLARWRRGPRAGRLGPRMAETTDAAPDAPSVTASDAGTPAGGGGLTAGLPVAFIAIILSGATGLVFQSIWSRYLSHVFGASSVAISTTVTVFMAGLGLGAFLAGRVADRIKHPLMTYAFVEGLVGLWALLLPALVDPEGWLADVNRTLHAGDVGAFGLILGRFAAVLPILLVPTTLMGASLPLLSQHFVSRRGDAGNVGALVGALYAVTTLGACTGVGLGTFVLMPLLGVSATNGVAAFANLLLAAGLFAARGSLLRGRWTQGEPIRIFPSRPAASWLRAQAEEDAAAAGRDAEVAAGDAGPAPADAPLPVPPLARKAALVVFAVSGLASLCYEVVWSRALAMTIGSSFQSFGLILLTFLAGIAGGSAVASGTLAPRRLLGTSALTAGGLIFFAAAPFGVDRGLGVYLLVCLAFLLPIGVIGVGAAQQRRRVMAGPESPATPALLMLAVPASAGLLVPLVVDGRFAAIAGAVTVCLAAFLAVVVAFRRFPVLQLAMMALFIGVAAFVNYVFQDEVPCAFASLVSSVDSLADSVGLVRFFMFLTVALCTLPATVGMGAFFPLVLRLWSLGGQGVGRDVGVVYASNTLGSVLGAWLPGFVLMENLGMERTILVGIFLYLGSALVLLILGAADEGEDEGARGAEQAGDEGEGDEREGTRTPAWYAVTIYVLAPLIPALIAGAFFLGWRPEGAARWSLSQMTLGVFRVSLATDACSDAWGEPDLVYYHDGLSTTVTVERWGRHYALKNNGKVDASNGDDMPTQIMVSAYPLLLHEKGPADLDVAIIGFGSGVSVGTALDFPVASVDVIELERSIIDASKFFGDVNGLAYVKDTFPYVEMDRLTIVNDDGRNHLASTEKTYDVIISEPSNPWITGVSDLFTTDHFRIAKRRLREGGIFCEWVQLYELSPENIKTIYRTFASQFEHVAVFAAEDLSSDTVILGSDSPLPMDLRRVRRAMGHEGVSEELERAYVRSPFDVFARLLLGSRQEVMQFARIEHRRRGGAWTADPASNNPSDQGCTGPDCYRQPAPLNTDANALIELAAPRDLIGFPRFEGYLANIYSPDWPYGRMRRFATGFSEDGAARADEMAELALSLMAHGQKPEAAHFITRAQRAGRSRETYVAAEVLTKLMSTEGEPPVRVETPVPGPQLAAREARQLMEGFAEVRASVDAGAYGNALAAMEDIPAPLRMHSGPGLRLLYAYLLYKTAPGFPSRYRDAIDQLEDLVRGEADYVARHPEVFYLLGRAHDAELHFDKAVRNMRIYVQGRIRSLESAEPAPEDAPVSGEGDEASAADAAAKADRTDGDLAADEGTEDVTEE